MARVTYWLSVECGICQLSVVSGQSIHCRSSPFRYSHLTTDNGQRSPIQPSLLNVITHAIRHHVSNGPPGGDPRSDLRCTEFDQRRLHHIRLKMTEFRGKGVPIQRPAGPGDDHEIDLI